MIIQSYDKIDLRPINLMIKLRTFSEQIKYNKYGIFTGYHQCSIINKIQKIVMLFINPNQLLLKVYQSSHPLHVQQTSHIKFPLEKLEKY